MKFVMDTEELEGLISQAYADGREREREGDEAGGGVEQEFVDQQYAEVFVGTIPLQSSHRKRAELMVFPEQAERSTWIETVGRTRVAVEHIAEKWVGHVPDGTRMLLSQALDQINVTRGASELEEAAELVVGRMHEVSAAERDGSGLVGPMSRLGSAVAALERAIAHAEPDNAFLNERAREFELRAGGIVPLSVRYGTDLERLEWLLGQRALDAQRPNVRTTEPDDPWEAGDE